MDVLTRFPRRPSASHRASRRKGEKKRDKFKAKVKKKCDIKIYKYICEKYDYIYIYIIYTLYTYMRFALGFYPNATSPFLLRASPLSLLCNRNDRRPPFLPSPPSLPPSLPPEESSRALPILQYLYFSMLKPRYIINYINKHRSPVISRTNVT